MTVTLGVLVLLSCSAPPRPSPPTLEALRGQVSTLSAQLTVVPSSPPLTSTATAEPSSTPTAEPEPTPEPTTTPTLPPPPATAVPTRSPRTPTAADAAPCALGQVKANKSSKIYHVPGGSSYARTRATVECFNSEAEAASAGYRRALN